MQLEHSPEGTTTTTSRVSRLVRSRILERACLLLHDIDKPNCPLRPNLQPGAEETLRQERFTVIEVDSIACTLRFGSQSQTESASACVMSREGQLLVHVVDTDDSRLLLEAVGDALVSEVRPSTRH